VLRTHAARSMQYDNRARWHAERAAPPSRTAGTQKYARAIVEFVRRWCPRHAPEHAMKATDFYRPVPFPTENREDAADGAGARGEQMTRVIVAQTAAAPRTHRIVARGDMIHARFPPSTRYASLRAPARRAKDKPRCDARAAQADILSRGGGSA